MRYLQAFFASLALIAVAALRPDLLATVLDELPEDHDERTEP